MEKKKVDLNCLLNLLNVLLIAIVLVLSFTTFWKFKGNVASIHDLVGWPSENHALQEYLITKTHNASFINTAKQLLNYNSFVYGPLLIIAGGVIGGFVLGIKPKLSFAWIFSVLYGITGILTFALIDFMRLGTTWKAHLVLYILITLIGIFQGVYRFFIDKEIAVKFDLESLFRGLTKFFAAATFVFLVATLITNMSYTKEKKKTADFTEQIDGYERQIRDFEREKEESGEVDEDAFSVEDLIEQVKKGKIDSEGVAFAKKLSEQIDNGTIRIPNLAEAKTLLRLVSLKNISSEKKPQIIELLEDVQKIIAENAAEAPAETPAETPAEAPAQQ